MLSRPPFQGIQPMLAQWLHELWAYLPKSGVTAARPTNVALGFEFFDTTLGYPVWWDGANWVDAAGTPA